MSNKCRKGEVHELPEGQNQWPLERCNLLVAAGVDGCGPCQTKLARDLTDGMSEEFGQLFTSWVFLYFDAISVCAGSSRPSTMKAAFGPMSLSAFSNSMCEVLAGVQLIWRGPVVQIDAESAARTLQAMTVEQRYCVLQDVLDGLVGDIAVMGRV